MRGFKHSFIGLKVQIGDSLDIGQNARRNHQGQHMDCDQKDSTCCKRNEERYGNLKKKKLGRLEYHILMTNHFTEI